MLQFTLKWHFEICSQKASLSLKFADMGNFTFAQWVQFYFHLSFNTLHPDLIWRHHVVIDHHTNYLWHSYRLLSLNLVNPNKRQSSLLNHCFPSFLLEMYLRVKDHCSAPTKPTHLAIWKKRDVAFYQGVIPANISIVFNWNLSCRPMRLSSCF